MEQEQELTAASVLAQLRFIATADVTQVAEVADGQLCVKNTRQLPEAVRAAICSIEKTSGGVKVKFYDKLKALELLGKALGVFEQRPCGKDADNDLLQAVLRSTEEVMDTHDLPELQQAAAAGYDLVEQAETA